MIPFIRVPLRSRSGGQIGPLWVHEIIEIDGAVIWWLVYKQSRADSALSRGASFIEESKGQVGGCKSWSKPDGPGKRIAGGQLGWDVNVATGTVAMHGAIWIAKSVAGK